MDVEDLFILDVNPRYEMEIVSECHHLFLLLFVC